GGTDATDPTSPSANPAAGNVIVFNTFNGIAVVESSGGPGSANGNRLTGNSISGNKLLGIDLNTTAGSVSLNDNKDPDAGANHTQNFPVISFAESGSAFGTHIQATLNSTTGHTFRVELYGIEVVNT